MSCTPRTPRASSRAPRRRLASRACALSALCLALAPSAAGAHAAQLAESGAGALKTGASANLEECVTAIAQAERSATFSGEMAAIAGSARMEMRIRVLERASGETVFHAISAPGLGVWRTAAPGVKVYKDLRQVTNLSAPAFYRGAISFRWLNARGRLIKTMELRTPRCEQPEAPAASSPSPPAAPQPVMPSTSG
jgi:hypothetical protein